MCFRLPSVTNVPPEPRAGKPNPHDVALTSALMMIISKEASLMATHADTARAWLLNAYRGLYRWGIIFMREKRGGPNHRSGSGASSWNWTCDYGGFWFFRFPWVAIIVIVQKLAYQPILQGKQRQVPSWKSQTQRLYSRYIITATSKTNNRFKSKRANLIRKYELADSYLFINDEEIIIENLKTSIPQVKRKISMVIKRVKLRTEDVNQKIKIYNKWFAYPNGMSS